MRGAAARGRDRPRDDSVDRVPARSRALSASCRGSASSRTARWRRSRSSRERRSQCIRTIAADTSSRTSNALLRILCVRAVRHRSRVRADGAGLRRDAAALRCGADHRRPGAVSRSATREARRRSIFGEEWTAMTGLPFVWAFWAGRPEPCRSEGLTALTAARDAGRCRIRQRSLTTTAGRTRAALGRAYLRENIRYTPGRARRGGAASVLRARSRARARRGDASPRVLLRSVSEQSTMTIADLESKVREGGRVDRARGARALSAARRRRCSAGWPTTSAPASIPSASSPTSSTATSTTRTSASRGATSARSTGRSDRARATCSGSRRSSGRSTRRSRVGGVQLLLQGGHNPDLPLDVVRGSVPRGQAALSRRSSCTRCRRRK